MTTQRQLERIWKAARAAGQPVVQTLVEIDGTIRIIHTDKPEESDNEDAWDKWIGDE